MNQKKCKRLRKQIEARGTLTTATVYTDKVHTNGKVTRYLSMTCVRGIYQLSKRNMPRNFR